MCEARPILGLPTSTDVFDALHRGRSATGGARIIQAAPAGRWEEARSIDMPAGPDSARSLVREVGALDADVAVEVEWLGHPLLFVGARGAPADREGFEKDVARVAQLDPAEPALALETLAGETPADLDHVELGAANAWQSVGPLRVWTRGEDPPAAAEVLARLDERPALARCVAPVALEVTFRRPRECWIGVEVSEPAGDGHVVAAASLGAMIERLFREPRRGGR